MTDNDIKKAKDILEDYSNYYSQVDLETLAKFLHQIKSEAIKEFANLFKNTLCKEMFHSGANIHKRVDNLVKEMTEGSE